MNVCYVMVLVEDLAREFDKKIYTQILIITLKKEKHCMMQKILEVGNSLMWSCQSQYQK